MPSPEHPHPPRAQPSRRAFRACLWALATVAIVLAPIVVSAVRFSLFGTSSDPHRLWGASITLATAWMVIWALIFAWKQTAPRYGKGSVIDDPGLIRAILDQCDVSCPGCAYSHRGGVGGSCPECGALIRLYVNPVQPHSMLFPLTLVGASLGLGFFGLGLVSRFIQEFLMEGYDGYVDLFWLVGTAVYGVVVVLLLLGERRLQVVSRTGAVALMAAMWALSFAGVVVMLTWHW